MAGIYVHIPFCIQKCTYCDFTSFKAAEGDMDAYFAGLLREIGLRRKELENYTFDTVYFGGGTPTAAPAEYVTAALMRLKELYNIAGGAEITLEMNPGTIDSQKLSLYRGAGFNRFSVGLQTADDRELLRLNRIHTSAQYSLAAHLLKGENFSCDILIGLHDQTAEDLKKTVDFAVSSGVKHVSMYALKAEEGTPMYTDYLNGELPSDDECAELYDAGVKFLGERGFGRYEVSNFCLPGFESRHNLNYWRRGEYIGFGIAAHSFIKERRFSNVTNLADYLRCVTTNRCAEIFSEDITEEEAKAETIMLALRTAEGFRAGEFGKRFKTDFFREYGPRLDKLEKYLEISGERIRIKDEYLYVQNSIIIDLIG